MKKQIVKLHAGVSGFTEDKDEAKRIRIETILPALERKEGITLDFSELSYSTQSFVHALLGEVLQRFRESALERLEFRNCTPQLKSLIQLVVDYSLGGFRKDQPKTNGEPTNGASKQSQRSVRAKRAPRRA